MKKIVVTQDLELNKREKDRLNKLGKVVYFDDLAKTPQEWLERCQNADIICTGKFGLKSEKLYELKNKFFSLPFVGVGFLDLKKLKSKNIQVSNCPGCNKEAVSEWIVAMLLNLLRQLPQYINNPNLSIKNILQETIGLANKNVTILGTGNIGSRVGKILKSFGMNITYFRRNDNLINSVKKADVVINTLSHNPDTTGILDAKFFNSLKKGSYFITVTSSKIYDHQAMINALNKNILAGVADDCGSIQVGNINDPFYIKLTNHPKILTTPHIAYNTDITSRNGNKMMIDNIKNYLNGAPINLVT